MHKVLVIDRKKLYPYIIYYLPRIMEKDFEREKISITKKQVERVINIFFKEKKWDTIKSETKNEIIDVVCQRFEENKTSI